MKTILQPMNKTLYCLKHPYIKTTVLCQRCKTPLCKDCRLQSEKTADCSSYCLNIDRAYRIFNQRRHQSYKKDIFTDAERLAKQAGNFAGLLFVSFILVALLLPTISTKLPKELAISQQSIQKSVKVKTPEKITYSRISPSAVSISRVKNAGKNLSITFDGGSRDSSATDILNILS